MATTTTGELPRLRWMMCILSLHQLFAVDKINSIIDRSVNIHVVQASAEYLLDASVHQFLEVDKQRQESQLMG